MHVRTVSTSEASSAACRVPRSLAIVCCAVIATGQVTTADAAARHPVGLPPFGATCPPPPGAWRGVARCGAARPSPPPRAQSAPRRRWVGRVGVAALSLPQPSSCPTATSACKIVVESRVRAPHEGVASRLGTTPFRGGPARTPVRRAAPHHYHATPRPYVPRRCAIRVQTSGQLLAHSPGSRSLSLPARWRPNPRMRPPCRAVTCRDVAAKVTWLVPCAFSFLRSFHRGGPALPGPARPGRGLAARLARPFCFFPRRKRVCVCARILCVVTVRLIMTVVGAVAAVPLD